MYFDIALKVVKQLDKIYGKDNYEYSIWHKNGRHDVEVRYKNQVFDNIVRVPELDENGNEIATVFKMAWTSGTNNPFYDVPAPAAVKAISISLKSSLC